MTSKLCGGCGDGAESQYGTSATRVVRNNCIGGGLRAPPRLGASRLGAWTAIPDDSTRPRWPRGPAGKPWGNEAC
eukprot:CAMPEP_0180802224 /NCGR_PEP_ID=MMETSP1038_2-20121128/60166_1 /TAXON_ID=632150 /ORGANISM="Azadinium spinosum, Strain 3D9" /LENGTH=74 /DNA_ID=CAMNT_0022842291 /DNA_START=414 /DNA_END=641 /DNA_ORIENTATION=-